MKVYTPLEETSTYRDLYDSYNQTVDNLSSTDFLYESSLSDGRVFSDQPGYVNLQEAHMGQSITIAAADLGDFKIRDFIYYSRKYNTYKVMDINCDLTGYKDGRVHFLYVLLQTGGTYEVYDNMQENTDERMLFARFVIDTSGNSVQFYLAAPFAGSPDYIKSNPTFVVDSGLGTTGTNNNHLIVAPGKIRFPGINFDNKSDPDVLSLDISDDSLPLRYITWDSTHSRPTVNWSSATSTTLDFSKYINYSTGALSNVGNNKFTIQKVYLDPYTKTGVVEYGDTVYNSLEDAMKVLSTVASYPLVDGVKYLIPLAAIVNKKGNTDLTDDTVCSVVKLVPNEDLIFGLDQASQQMALEAQLLAQQAMNDVGVVQGNLTNHINNVSNPHSVTKAQVGLDKVDNKSAATIRDETITYINNNLPLSSKYLPLTGGTITGTLTVNGTITARSSVSITGSLSVSGQTTLGATTVSSFTCNSSASFKNTVRVINASLQIRDSGDNVKSYLSTNGDIISYSTLYGRNVTATDQYVSINGKKLYLGVDPSSISGASAGDYAIYVS